jgi:hypothetical protein
VLYGSTVDDLMLALDLWEQMFYPSGGLDTAWDTQTVIRNGKLLPPLLGDLRYRPGDALMEKLAAQWFVVRSHESRLTPVADGLSNLNAWADANNWLSRSVDLGTWRTGVGDVARSSAVRTVRLVREFLRWLPPDRDLRDALSDAWDGVGRNDQALQEHGARTPNGLWSARRQWLNGFPSTLLGGLCRDWAGAFATPNVPHAYAGHVGEAVGDVRLPWLLVESVQTGPCGYEPRDPTAYTDVKNRFTTHRYMSFQGLRDGWDLFVGDHGMVAPSFEVLATVCGGPDAEALRQFARASAVGLYRQRLNTNRHLMPSATTPKGPTFIWDSTLGAHAADTDCLYWAHTMYEAHHAAGAPGPWLRPARRDTPAVNFGELPDVAAAIVLRRATLHRYMTRRIEPAESAGSATRFDFDGYGCIGRLDARRYVAMAVGITLDWIEHAFNPDWCQFLMMAPYEGDRLDLIWQRRHPDQPNAYAVLSGDSRQNTLRILIEAYEATRDRFYLDLFCAVWTHMTVNGPIATTYTAGRPDEPADASQQAGFLAIIAQAARAAHDAGWTRRSRELLDAANDHAAITRRAFEDSPSVRQRRGEHAPEPYGFALLALLNGPLTRVQLNSSTPFNRLHIDDLTGSTTTIHMPATGSGAADTVDEAVVYMRPGAYRIHTLASSTANDGIAVPIDVAATTTWTADADPGGYPRFAVGGQQIRL